MSVGGEFGRRVSDDELCAGVRQAVEDGDEDALRRLGFGGFGGYVQRLSEIMSDSVTDGLDPSADDFGAIMGEVASPARYAHHLVNEAGTAIQSAKDKPLGIHIKPAEPDFDDDALCGTVGKAVSMDDPERAVETLADGLGYAVKKAGNDFIKLNAEQRSRAGFEVVVKRSGSTKCCEWCAARIGSWALKNAPDGVFGCHANCSCTVEYTSSTGAKTSASGANLNRLGVGAFTEIEYQPPHVLSREEAKEKGGFDEPKRLTGAANGGIIDHIEFQTFYDGQSANDFFYYDTEERGLKARKDSSHSKWERGLSDDERSSIAGYAADEYQDINDYWRRVKGWEQINSDFVEQESRHIDSAIEKYEIKDNITVQRGVKEEFIDMLVERFDVQNDLSELVGKTFTEPGYSSTSALYGNPVATTKQVVIDIDVPSGKGCGAYINRLSGFQDKEYEFLIKRNASFTIREIKVEEQFGDYKYYMKVVMNNE